MFSEWNKPTKEMRMSVRGIAVSVLLFALVLSVAPVYPVATTIAIGSNAHCVNNCPVTNTGVTYTYYWQKNGINFLGPYTDSISSHSLTISSPLQRTDTVSLSVTATSKTTGLSSSAASSNALTVVNAPTVSASVSVSGLAFNVTATATTDSLCPIAPFSLVVYVNGVKSSSCSSSPCIFPTSMSAGTYSYSATVTDSCGNTASYALHTFTTYNPLAITCPTSTATVDTSYTSSANATGGSGSYSTPTVTGLSNGIYTPFGDRGYVVIAGSPISAGTVSPTISVTDTVTGLSASQTCTITVSNPLAITCPTSTATVGISYGSRANATGGSGTYSNPSVSGLSNGFYSPTNGPGYIIIAGSPISAGTVSPTISVTDTAGHSASQTCTITVYNPVTFTCPSSTSTVGTYYESSIYAYGGTNSYTCSKTGNLPLGLALSICTVSGTPAAGSAGSFTYTATVTDSAGRTKSQDCTVTVSNPVPTIAVTCPTATATDGSTYSSSVSASGGTSPYSYSITSGSLPSGLVRAGSVIAGVPSSTGAYSFTVRAMDSYGYTGTANCAITVSPAALALTCPSASVVEGGTYSGTVVASGGSGTYNQWYVNNWYLGKFAFGITGWSGTNGAVIGGSANSNSAGDYTYGVEVIDSATTLASQTCPITVCSSVCNTPPAQIYPDVCPTSPGTASASNGWCSCSYPTLVCDSPPNVGASNAFGCYSFGPSTPCSGTTCNYPKLPVGTGCSNCSGVCGAYCSGSTYYSETGTCNSAGTCVHTVVGCCTNAYCSGGNICDTATHMCTTCHSLDDGCSSNADCCSGTGVYCSVSDTCAKCTSSQKVCTDTAGNSCCIPSGDTCNHLCAL